MCLGGEGVGSADIVRVTLWEESADIVSSLSGWGVLILFSSLWEERGVGRINIVKLSGRGVLILLGSLSGFWTASKGQR